MQVCELLGLKDPFADNPQAEPADDAERERRAAHVRAVEEGFARLGVAEAVAALAARRVPAGEVRRLDQLFDDEQVRANGLVQSVEQPGVGPVRLLGSVFKVDGRTGGRGRPAPGLGRARGRAARSADPLMRVVSDLPRPVRTIDHVWIPLADGTRLGARIWLPEDAESDPVPAILEYIPYRKGDGTAPRDWPRHVYFAGHGYAALRVDLRGIGRVRRPAPRRVPAAGAGGRARGAPLDRGAALVHRARWACSASPGAASTASRWRRTPRPSSRP